MVSNSVIFMDCVEDSYKNVNNGHVFKKLFYVQLDELPFRIFSSLMPPLVKKFQKVYIDLVGPLLAMLTLTALINCGYYLKQIKHTVSPTEMMLAYSLLMPVLCRVLCKLGQSQISIYKLMSLLGYALYGHIFTLLVSYLCFQERSNSFFFMCLIIFSGLSTLRVVLIIMSTISVPAARLIVCSTISVINILFIVFVHFVYMHRTFVYKLPA